MTLLHKASPPSEDMVYPMRYSWYSQVRSMALEDNLPCYLPPYQWRRHLCEDIYHDFRAAGYIHEQAIKDTLRSLELLELDDDGNAYLRLPE